MCRWLTYVGDPIYLEELIYEPDHSLVAQSQHAAKAKVPTNGDGFGIGWYQDREFPGVYREVLPAWNDRNLRSLAQQIKARLFFAHVRASTGTETIRPNCHPFSHGRWLFMHNGQIGGYARVRRRLEALIPDRFYEHRRGTTDSELIFMLLLANELDSDPAAAIGRTIEQIEAATAADGITAPLRLTAALTDGTNVFAIRYASDHRPPSLFYRREDTGFIIVSEPLDMVPGTWKPLAPNHLLLASGLDSLQVWQMDDMAIRTSKVP